MHTNKDQLFLFLNIGNCEQNKTQVTKHYSTLKIPVWPSEQAIYSNSSFQCNLFPFFPCRWLYSTIIRQHRVSLSCGLEIKFPLPGQIPLSQTSLYRYENVSKSSVLLCIWQIQLKVSVACFPHPCRCLIFHRNYLLSRMTSRRLKFPGVSFKSFYFSPLQFLEMTLKERAKQGSFHVTQAILTPTVNTVAKGLVWGLRSYLVERSVWIFGI